MDKNTAYQVISQFRANNCRSGALANALDVALKVLKPVATNNVYVIKLEILGTTLSTLWLETSNDKKRCKRILQNGEVR